MNGGSAGALPLSNGRTRFRVWAPFAGEVDLRLMSPEERVVPLSSAGCGYFEAVLDGVRPGARYVYRLDRKLERPDPASRYQPEGVHAPSMVVSPEFEWHDAQWRNLALADYVTYEIHVGAFSRDGTFDGVIPQLVLLRDLGITALELMPAAQFPGNRNWGYDGVYPYAVQTSYGGPEGLRRLVDACHSLGLAVVLDVVYNHLGPDGNYLGDFGPYFTDHYRTPWGPAMNLDGPQSDGVRRFFIDNALYWFRDFHIDALRLDAVHALYDSSATPFLRELADQVSIFAKVRGRPFYLIAESSLNDPKVVRSSERGGWGIDAQWNDDFHHALHAVLTGERNGCYVDFTSVRDLATSFERTFVFTGQQSEYRQRRFGAPCDDVPLDRFVVFAQNHDQVGNRMLGERLSSLVSFEGLKLTAAVVCLSPYLPLLFMGEEYGETAPFLYFVSHSDPQLIEAVRKGRREEFASFGWGGQLPDPQAEETFQCSKLDRLRMETTQGSTLFRLYKELLRLRRWHPALQFPTRETISVEVLEEAPAIILHRRRAWAAAVAIFHFGKSEPAFEVQLSDGRWRKVLDTADEIWGGTGSRAPATLEPHGPVSLSPGPESALLYESAGKG